MQTKTMYKEINGTFYHKQTPDEVINILESSRQNKTRLTFDFGDTKTGKSWNEQFDITGHVGRSTGNIKIPLLIKNVNSIGGGGLLDHCIVGIKYANKKKGGILYKLTKQIYVR